MRTNTFVFVFADLTVHAKNLVLGRKALLFYIVVKRRTAAFVHAGTPFSSTVVVHMINREKHRLGFFAARADVSAIRCINQILDPGLVTLGLVSFSSAYRGCFFWRSFSEHPVAEDFAVTLDLVWVRSAPIPHP